MNYYLLVCNILSDSIRKETIESLSINSWEQLVHTAKINGVAPLVYKYFVRKGWSINVPSSAFQSLAKEYFLEAANNELLFRELQVILVAFSYLQIPVILLKGAALAQDTYEDPALRPMYDLDIYIHPENYRKSIDILTSLNWHLVKVTHHAVFRKKSIQAISLELHWKIIPIRLYDNESWFWERLESITISNNDQISKIYRLSDEAQLLYLATHQILLHRKNPRLIWYVDIDKHIRNKWENINWPLLMTQANRYGLYFVLTQALIDTQKRLDTPLRQEINIATRDKMSVSSSFILIRAAEVLPWKYRLHMYFHLLFPGQEYMTWMYNPRPNWLWPICYIKRWSELGLDAILHVDDHSSFH